MTFSFPPPKNEADFERLCLEILKAHWQSQSLRLYGRRGQSQSGIDIVDLETGERPHGAQCKRYDPSKPISPTSIEAAVEKAKDFRPPLGELALMTTAVSSTAAQQAVMQLNRSHTKAGLFTVTLFHWEDIEHLLRQYQQVASVLYPQLYAGSALTEINTSVQSIAVGVQQLTGRGFVDVDRDIADAKEEMQRGDYTIAKWRLSDLKSKRWDNLTAAQKFRVQANLGSIEVAQGNPKKGALMILEAVSFDPTHERAVLNQALAHYWLGDRQKAFEAASSHRKAFPSSMEADAVWIASAPPTYVAADLENQVLAVSLENAQVLIALSHRYFEENRIDLAEERARTALKTDVAWPLPPLVLARILIRKHMPRGFRQDFKFLDDSQKDSFREAEQLLGQAIERAEDKGEVVVRSDALIERANLLRFLYNDEEHKNAARQDAEAAHAINPEDSLVRREYAELMRLSGRYDDAIGLIRALMDEGRSPDLVYMLASTLRERARKDDLVQAGDLFAELAVGGADSVPEDFRIVCIESAIACFSASNERSKAGALVEGMNPALFRTALREAANARVLLSFGMNEQAKCSAGRALAELDAASTIAAKEYIATVLEGAGLFREALDLWRSIIEEQPKEASLQRYIRCATRMNAHSDILQGCEILRNKGYYNRDLLLLETDIREDYDIGATIKVLQEYLGKKPEDGVARVILSYLGVKHERPELVDLQHLPEPATLPTHIARAAVVTLKMGGDSSAAVRYAYGLLHARFDDPESHRAFMFALHPVGPKVDLPTPVTAGPGTAVLYSEEGDSFQRWLVIEDELKPDTRLAEVSPDHRIAKELAGKKVGDVFVLVADPVIPRNAKVIAILNKYVHRYQQTLAEFQTRFPGLSDIRLVHVGKPGSPGVFDFAAIEKITVTGHADTLEVLSQYRQRPLPVHLVADAAGKSDAEAVLLLATQDEPFIRACLGNDDERSRSLAALKLARAVVADVICLTTLATVDALGELGRLGIPVLVSQSTNLVFQELLRDARGSKPPSGYLGAQHGRLILTEPPESFWQNRIQWLNSVTEHIEKYCKIIPVNALAAVEADRREGLIEIFGRHGAESVILASEPGYVLWSDDFVIRSVSANEYGVQSVWTQLALEHLMQTGRLTPERFVDISSRLIGAGYHFTGINVEMFMKAGELTQWNIGRQPLRQALEHFAADNIDLIAALQMVAQIMRRMSREIVLPEVQTSVVSALLTAISKRADGRTAIGSLRRVLPQIFGLDVVACQRIVAVIDAWRQQHRSTRLIEV